MKLNELVAASLATPAHHRVALNPYERGDAFEVQAVARCTAAWSQTNREALTYSGEDGC
jgi:hypothetical protein